LALFHCREYGSIRLGPARGKLAKHEGLEAGGDWMQRTFDVQAVREQFPALGRTHNSRGVVYFDGPGGSQVARQAIDAITGYMERGGANLQASSRRARRPRKSWPIPAGLRRISSEPRPMKSPSGQT
jgi:hypothetical protein